MSSSILRLPSLATALVLSFLICPSAQAQSHLGPYAGFEFLDQLAVIGVDARIPTSWTIEEVPVEAQPAMSLYFGSGQLHVQGDANLIYDIPIEDPEFKLQPYTGAGLGVEYSSVSQDVDLLLNIIGGTKFDVGESFTPFTQIRLGAGSGANLALQVGILLPL